MQCCTRKCTLHVACVAISYKSCNAIEDAVPINFSDYSTYKHKLISDLQIGGKYNGNGSLVHRLHARTRDM